MSRSLRLLLGSVTVFHVGWYLLLPFFALLFTTQRGLAPSQAGMLLALQSVSLLLGSILGAGLTDAVGRRLTMTTGLMVRAAGLAGLGYTGSLEWLIPLAILAGLGGGLFAPAAKAAIAVVTPDEQEGEAFSWRSVAATVGTAAGPLIGAALLGSMPLMFGVSALLHLATVLLVWMLPEERRVEARRPREPWRDTITNRGFFFFIHNTGWMWALFAQLALSVPLYAGAVLGLGPSIGLLFSLSSLALVFLQVPVTRVVTARLNSLTAMAVGSVLMGAGFGLVAFAGGFWGLLGAMLVVTFGQMLVVPTADSVTSAMAPKEALGAYFGVATLAWGLGEAFGVWSGGLFMELSLATGMLWLPWAVSAGAGVAIGGLFYLSRILVRIESGPPRPYAFDRPSPQDGVMAGTPPKGAGETDPERPW